MCLYVNNVKTEQAKSREEDCVTRYKVVRLFKENGLDGQVGEVRSWYYIGYKWQIGWNVATSQPHIKYDYTEIAVVDEGIHVYTSKECAKQFEKECADQLAKYAQTMSSRPMVIEIKCYKEDLIAVGASYRDNESEAYTKVYLEEIKQCV